MKLKVLIGTAYYKNEELTRNWIKNVEEQLLKHQSIDVNVELTIMVVNGGSEKVELSNGIYLSLPENISFSGNFNFVLKEFLKNDYDYVIIMNNDSYFTSKYDLLNLVVQSMNLSLENPYIIVSPTPNNIVDYNYLKMGSTGTLTQYPMFPAVCWCMNKQTVEEIGLLDERFEVGCYEDDDYCMRVSLKKGWVVVTSTVNITHLVSQTMSLFNQQKAMNDNRERFKEKWKK